MLNLLIDQPIFIGFKAAGALRHMLESLAGADKKYVSCDDSTFLRTFQIGNDLYVGKVIHDPLVIDRVEDIERNILSILRKIGPSVRLPASLRILACGAEVGGYVPASKSSLDDEMTMPRALVR